MLDKNDILGNLNDRQSEAVETTEGHVRVVAGAGSGKTRVLAHRYAFLVNELGIDPGNILCMTFTNKAAQEMKRRISKLVHRGNVNDFVCTIHGFCVKFLREEIFRIGYPKNFIISDEEDSKMLAKQVMEEFNIGIDKTNVRKFLDGIRDFKSLDIDYYIDNIILPNSDISISKEDKIIRYSSFGSKNSVLYAVWASWLSNAIRRLSAMTCLSTVSSSHSSISATMQTTSSIASQMQSMTVISLNPRYVSLNRPPIVS